MKIIEIHACSDNSPVVAKGLPIALKSRSKLHMRSGALC